jgi:hypothetical protein
MEKNILYATSLGYGTCWVGGSFKRSNFALKINLDKDEILPAITPLGYFHDSKTMREGLIRYFARSNSRIPWEGLFSYSMQGLKLEKVEAGKYSVVLESVRIAPSASNKQPWRIIKDNFKAVYHFFLNRTKGYDKLYKEIKLQNIDMGIAMCHFEMAATELRLKGRWKEKKPDGYTGEMEYIVSWIGEE